MTDRYLDALLRVAVTAPGAESAGSVGRIIGQLLVLATTEGGSETVAPYLSALPGEPAIFEVRQFHSGDSEATVVAGGLDAGDAVRLRAENPETDALLEPAPC